MDDLTQWRALVESLGATIVGGCQWGLTRGAHRLTLTPSAQRLLRIEVDVGGIPDDLVVASADSFIVLDASARIATGDPAFDAEVFLACNEPYGYLDAKDRALLRRLVAAGVTVRNRRIHADVRADGRPEGLPPAELVARMMGLAERLGRTRADRTQAIAEALERASDTAPVLEALARRCSDPEVARVRQVTRMLLQSAPSPEGLALLSAVIADGETGSVHRAHAAARLLRFFPLEEVHPLLGLIKEHLRLAEIDDAVRPQVGDATRPWESRRAGLQILADCGLQVPTSEVTCASAEHLARDPRGLSLLLWLGTHPLSSVRQEVIGRALDLGRAGPETDVAAYASWIEDPRTALDLARMLFARPSRTAAEDRLLTVLATRGSGESRAVAAEAVIEPTIWALVEARSRFSFWQSMSAGNRHELVVRTLALAAESPARAAAALAGLLEVLPQVENYHERWRAKIIRALGESGDPQWTPRLFAELDAADPAVQEAAFEALGRLGDGAALRALAPYAKRRGNSSAVTRAARRAIEAIRARLGADLTGALTLADAHAHGQLTLAPEADDDER